MIATLALLLLGAPVPVAAPLPRHVVDAQHPAVAAEAGDEVVVRLPEHAAGWQRTGPLPANLVETGAGVAARPRSVFVYRLRGAGRAELTFARRGAGSPAALTFRVDAR